MIRPSMLIAVSSASFGALFGRGSLTHPEWVEACASRLDADGLTFALADLPRTDPEYIAQVRKMATDLALVPIALDAPGLLDPAVPDSEREAALALAAGLGVLLLRTTAGPPGALPPETFATTAAVAKPFASLAKRAGATILVRPEPGTLVRDTADAKHLAKDVDSAWLRFELPSDVPDRDRLGPRDRVLVERVALGADPAAFVRRRAWFVLDGDGGETPFERVAATIAAFRAAEARAILK